MRVEGTDGRRPREARGPLNQIASDVSWRPTLGAWIEGNGTRFRVWAPTEKQVELVIQGDNPRVVPLERHDDGTWGTHLAGVGDGTRYQYRLPTGDFPDPASRFQPEGVHGPSEVVDCGAFNWTDRTWRGINRDDLILYELHVGAFSPEGTFDGVRRRLDYLVDLGINAIEFMPIADFPGERNWGYDGVSLFAPARCYGRPDDLRRLIDDAHQLGIAVFLDVVYNHLGPEGNYLPTFSPYYFHKDRESPWGQSLNFDGPHSEMVRRFFIENAQYWIHQFHFDGLRLDATHAIHDESDIPFAGELATRARNSVTGRTITIIAEDHRNLAYMIRPEGEGGWGLDGVWADDFHHGVRVALAGDNEGYYQDYEGSMSQLAETLNRGWFYSGRFSEHSGQQRGTDSSGIPPRRFVFCIQNHDQIGNRALGERLNHQIDEAAYRAASVLMLCAPATPMLFMGQEWASGSPFLYFTDHPEELGRLVTEGRRREFRHFRMFADEDARDQIPDPQVVRTFERSRLDWSEPSREPHASMLELYRALLALRKTEPAIRNPAPRSFRAWALTDTTLLLRQDAEQRGSLLAIIQMHGSAAVDLKNHPALDGLAASRLRVLLTTEAPPFAIDCSPPEIDQSGEAPHIRFHRPSAVLLRAVPSARIYKL